MKFGHSLQDLHHHNRNKQSLALLFDYPQHIASGNLASSLRSHGKGCTLDISQCMYAGFADPCSLRRGGPDAKILLFWDEPRSFSLTNLDEGLPVCDHSILAAPHDLSIVVARSWNLPEGTS